MKQVFIDPANKQEIQALLDKYMSGETTNQEEALLRDCFAKMGSNIPQEWLPYKAMFSFVAAERLLQQKPQAEQTAATASALQPKRHPNKRIYWASVAASLLFIVCCWIGRQPASECYVVIDGKTYTNKQEVKQEAMEALQMVSENHEDPFSALNMMQ